MSIISSMNETHNSSVFSSLFINFLASSQATSARKRPPELPRSKKKEGMERRREEKRKKGERDEVGPTSRL